MNTKQNYVTLFRGNSALKNGIDLARQLRAQGLVEGTHWGWHYYPSNTEQHKRAEFWASDSRLLTILALKSAEPPKP
jgi:hypothetical protein